MNTKIRQIALKRIHTLFLIAKTTCKEDLALAQRYVDLARKIAMIAEVSLPIKYRRQICRRCKRFIVPGFTAHVRIKKMRVPHLSITCLQCGKKMRIPLKGRSGTKKFLDDVPARIIR